jgi:SWI/SNF-related matrix-associated actin-dependent regulator 1 of chromatin subfamily A
VDSEKVLRGALSARPKHQRSGCSSHPLFSRVGDLVLFDDTQGRKIVVFTQFLDMVDILVEVLTASGITATRVDGRMPPDERLETIHRFNTLGTIQVLVASTRACGTGVNITGAAICVIHDMDLNPAIDSQVQ